MSHDDDTVMRWARFRFSVIGPLLASPPVPGELAEQVRELSQKSYQHPTHKREIRFGESTIERWYYQAKGKADPLGALSRKVPAHAGTHPTIKAGLAKAVAVQYKEHPGWTFQLHYDNLLALSRQEPALGEIPSYPTIRRYMKGQGLLRQRKPRGRTARLQQEAGWQRREKRSYEVSHVHQLWHLDFHEGSRKVLTSWGQWRTPMLLGILDDHSRLCCHMQWYLDETAEVLIHGLGQALAKRGLPRALMTDNGSAMMAQETTLGLVNLGIVHDPTLAYTPEQNGKQECFWGQVEGRLIPMLEGVPELTLALLNEATQAWVEQEYQHKTHSELNESPVVRALRGPSVVRPCPGQGELNRAFRMQTTRTQRLSDGTFTVRGIRFEVPTRYRTLQRLTLRVARWDLSSVDLCDPRTGTYLCTALPLDKAKNADRRRRVVASGPPLVNSPLPAPSGIAPHLRALMQQYAQTGLPPAYLPKHDLSEPTPELAPDEEN